MDGSFESYIANLDSDSFSKYIQELATITPAIANGIATRYTSQGKSETWGWFNLLKSIDPVSLKILIDSWVYQLIFLGWVESYEWLEPLILEGLKNDVEVRLSGDKMYEIMKPHLIDEDYMISVAEDTTLTLEEKLTAMNSSLSQKEEAIYKPIDTTYRFDSYIPDDVFNQFWHEKCFDGCMKTLKSYTVLGWEYFSVSDLDDVIYFMDNIPTNAPVGDLGVPFSSSPDRTVEIFRVVRKIFSSYIEDSLFKPWIVWAKLKEFSKVSGFKDSDKAYLISFVTSHLSKRIIEKSFGDMPIGKDLRIDHHDLESDEVIARSYGQSTKVDIRRTSIEWFDWLEMPTREESVRISNLINYLKSWAKWKGALKVDNNGRIVQGPPMNSNTLVTNEQIKNFYPSLQLNNWAWTKLLVKHLNTWYNQTKE